MLAAYLYTIRSVDKETSYCLDGRGTGARFPEEERDLSPVRSPHWLWGQPICYAVGTGNFFLEDIAAKTQSWLLPSSADVMDD
jgi:hypothetical protein